MIKVWVTGLLLFLTVTAAVASGLVSVSQKGRAFTTNALDVERGAVVQFLNEDSFLHQIYIQSPQLSYESAEQPPGSNVDIRFPASGTFEVRCHIHPKMLLRVSVK